jgi:hypothetical protein
VGVALIGGSHRLPFDLRRWVPRHDLYSANKRPAICSHTAKGLQVDQAKPKPNSNHRTTMSTEPKSIDPMVDVLVAGLAELQRRIKDRTLTSLHKGEKLKTLRIHLTEREVELRKTVSTVLCMHVGQMVSQALVLRVALSRLVDEAQRSLTDPVLAEKLKAEVLDLRAKKVPEVERANDDE